MNLPFARERKEEESIKGQEYKTNSSYISFIVIVIYRFHEDEDHYQ